MNELKAETNFNLLVPETKETTGCNKPLLGPSKITNLALNKRKERSRRWALWMKMKNECHFKTRLGIKIIKSIT